jgi:hypothetical protein
VGEGVIVGVGDGEGVRLGRGVSVDVDAGVYERKITVAVEEGRADGVAAMELMPT